MKPNPKYAKVADEATLNEVAAALEKNGMQTTVVKTGDDAKLRVLALIPKGAQLMTMTSQTLVSLGLVDVLNGKDYDPVRNQFEKVDERTKRQLGAAPDWVIGSCHAVTQDGKLVWASATGSQMAAFVYGAKQVVLVIGGQKVVNDLDDGITRLYDYALPLEDVRALKAYGMHSAVNKILVINHEFQQGRIHVILVQEELGF